MLSEFADLHLHSNRSDGLSTPIELVDMASQHNLRAIAIVDHDDISALDEAIPYGQSEGVEIIPGVELSVCYNQLEFHLLAYCFDYRNPDLLEYLDLFKRKRVARAQEMVHLLEKSGLPVSFEVVLKKAGEGTVGRPHIAEVLLEEGLVYSFQDAFNRFIGNGKPAYVASYRFELHRALALIHSAGGVCSIAHPGLEITNGVLLDLIKAGVNGIETIHPNHSQEQILYFRRIAEENGLFETGGSDYHGAKKGEDAFGHYNVPYEVVEKMKQFAKAG